MAAEYRWETKHLLINIYRGATTIQDLIAGVDALSGSAKSDDLRAMICDWTNAEFTQIEPEEIDKLTAHVSGLAKISPAVKHAVVIKDQESGLALASMYQFLAENISWEVEIFSSLEEAKDWVN